MTQLAMQFEPAPNPDPFAEVAEQAASEMQKLLQPTSMTPPAEACAAPVGTVRLGVNREGLTWGEWYDGTARRTEPTAAEGRKLRAAWRAGEDPTEYHPSFCDRLMASLEEANRRADADLQHLRELHAEIEGVPVDQLDQHLAAREAEEKRMREEARAEKPARASGGKAGKGSGATIGIGRAALSERQRELLAFVRVEDNVAIFSSEERVPDWDLLKRIMVALGGTWKTGGKKSPGGFRFPDDLDAAELVRLAKETGEITDPKAAEFFATPRALAEVLVDRADLDFCSRVLEPSAGLGGIALAARDRQPSAHVVCIEALEASAEKLRQLGFDTTCADFLSVTPASLNTFTHCLLNPPFSRRQDIQHVRHAYTFLEPGGVLVAIMSAGVKFREDKLAKDFRAWVTEHDGEIWDNPEGAFLESGTGVRTVMVRVRRSR